MTVKDVADLHRAVRSIAIAIEVGKDGDPSFDRVVLSRLVFARDTIDRIFKSTVASLAIDEIVEEEGD